MLSLSKMYSITITSSYLLTHDRHPEIVNCWILVCVSVIREYARLRFCWCMWAGMPALPGAVVRGCRSGIVGSHMA